MRFFSNRTTATALILGAALAVSACGGSKSTDTADNSTVTDLNSVEGTTNDMSTIDSATGNTVMDDSMAMDNAANGTVAPDNAGNAM